jgi:hypothetical protein
MTRLVATVFWTEAEAAVMMGLDAITPEGLCARAVVAGLSTPDAAQPDFAI